MLATVILDSWECHLFMIVKEKIRIFTIYPYRFLRAKNFHFKPSEQKKNPFFFLVDWKKKNKKNALKTAAAAWKTIKCFFSGNFIFHSFLVTTRKWGRKWKKRSEIMSEKSSVMSLLLKLQTGTIFFFYTQCATKEGKTAPFSHFFFSLFSFIGLKR